KGSPFLPRTPSILSKNFRVITFFASAKNVIALIAELHRNGAAARGSSIRVNGVGQGRENFLEKGSPFLRHFLARF
ncbi:MAG: hypothetical protein IJW17_06670, partial [Lentisphaeria bacterium]|nr:hypothetical protein [Lentisphaeria bacterium]